MKFVQKNLQLGNIHLMHISSMNNTADLEVAILLEQGEVLGKFLKMLWGLDKSLKTAVPLR